MVGIYNGSRILEISFPVHFQKQLKILIVIVGNGISVFVYRTSQDGMSQGIAGGFYFPAPVDEIVAVLCCHNRIKHHRIVSAGGVFHSGRYVHAADCEAVLLVLYGAGADSYV